MTSRDKTDYPKKIRAYSIVQPLGRGGMGEVLLAVHAELERPVALKRFAPPADLKGAEAARERFLREGKALARLCHQGIVGVHDLFEHRGELFLVLEYVDGVDLGSLLGRGPLPLDVACLVGLGLAEALDHAHFHSVLHRDLKAGNVMISRSGQVKLMDFGIARGEALARVTQTGILVGTPKYIAPEVLTEQEHSVRSDIYGLGAVLYHCLTGRRLFHGLAQRELYRAILAGRFEPLGKLAPQTPRPLRKMVERCLAREPQRRFGSAAELQCELDLYLAEAGIWGSRSERLARFMRRVDELGADQTMDSIEIDFDLPRGGRWPRRLLWAAVVLLAMGLGAFFLWGALQLGWLDPVLSALGD